MLKRFLKTHPFVLRTGLCFPMNIFHNVLIINMNKLRSVSKKDRCKEFFLIECPHSTNEDLTALLCVKREMNNTAFSLMLILMN